MSYAALFPKPLLVFFSIFFVLFAGDAELFGSRIIVLYAISAIPVFAWLRATLHRSQITAMLFASFVFFIYGARQSFNISEIIDGYYIWHFQFILQFVLAALSISLYVRFDEAERKIFMLCGLVIYVVLGLAVLMVGVNEGGRVHVVFGPNVLYRVIGFLTVLTVAHQLVCGRWVGVVGAVCFTAFLIFMVGSRGGLIVFIPLSIFIFHFVFREYKTKHLFAGFTVLACFGFVILGYQGDIEIDSRMVNLSIDDRYSSAGLRAYYLVWFVENFFHVFMSYGIEYSFFYDNFGSPGFLYPHNFFLELASFYGFFGVLVSLLLVYKLTFGILVCVRSHYRGEYVLFYSALCVFPGVLVSGYITDNLGVVVILYLAASYVISNSRSARGAA